MTAPEIRKIPASALDPFEWLALESLWATYKSPFPYQWQRWVNNPDLRDPQAPTGLVIGGNLSRAHTYLAAARKADSPETRTEFLSIAAGHAGKMAGGLISMATHLNMAPARWGDPLKDQLPAHFDMVDQVLERTAVRTVSSLNEEYYYYKLEPVAEAVNLMSGEPLPELLNEVSGKTVRAAAAATSTWLSFISEYDGLLLDPGATPRSTGTWIESLQRNFDQEIKPAVQAEAAIRRSA